MKDCTKMWLMELLNKIYKGNELLEAVQTEMSEIFELNAQTIPRCTDYAERHGVCVFVAV